MALTRVLLRRRKSLSSFARESCLSRSMVLGLIVFSLPMLWDVPPKELRSWSKRLRYAA